MPQLREADDDRDRTTAKYRNWEADSAATGTEPFKDLIQRDPVVCDHCFTYRYETENKQWYRGDEGLGWMPYSRWYPIPGRSTDVPAQMPSQGTRLACSYCGYRKEKHRPVDATEIAVLTGNICETLQRKGIGFDVERLVAEVRERMQEPENQGRQDSHVFRPAVRRAVRDI